MPQTKKTKRPDTPLAATPQPNRINASEANKKKVEARRAAAVPKNPAHGVVVSSKDEKAHPEDFKYLKNK